jgi:hypothetical protein
MPVTQSELKLLLEKPKNRRAIEEAKKREELIRFHSQVNFSEFENTYALRDFLDLFLKGIVTEYHQYNLYRLMLQFPVDTNPLMSEVYGALWKIFEGKDPVYNSEFLTPTAEDDWKQYREEWDLEKFWQHMAWHEFMCYPESFIVVDIASEQTTTLPEPYPYFLKIRDVIDYDHKDSPGEWEELKYLIFRIDPTHIAFFDITSYQVFETKENSTDLVKETLNNPHGLGICPATKLVHGEHPVSRFLTKLKKLLFSLLGQDITDFSIANPVWWVYEGDCNFEDPHTHDTCDGGFMKHEDEYVFGPDRRLMPCPKCQGRFRGHGTVLELPVPGDNEKGLGVPAGVIVTPVENLEHGAARVKSRTDEIYYGLVGYGSETPNDKAVNKQQVRALQESTEDKLNHLQKTFERAQQRTETTMCQLRYGVSFTSLSVSYGQTHYIDKPEDVLVSYQDARTKGDSDSILDGIYDNYILLKYKNNPEQLQRENILWHLEPFHHRSNSEVREMFRNFECDFNEYYIKINFSTLIAKFERENMSVLEFASALSFPKKIEAIYKTLESYATTIQTTNEARRKERAAEEQAGNGGGTPFDKQPA